MNPVFGGININSIRNFVEVADLGNITKAADALFITQPTLSRQLVQLENTFAVKLFYRNRNGVELTAAGSIVYNQCKNLLNAYDEFSSTILNLQDMISGNLNVAHQKNSADLVVDLHKKFLNTYPSVSITNFRQGRRSYLDLLMTGKVHLAYLPSIELTQSPESIKSLLVTTKRNMLLVSRQNPLAKRDRVHLEELKNELFIMPSKANSPYKLKKILEGCEQAGFSPNIASYAQHFVDYMQDIVRYDAVSIHPYMHNVEDSKQVKYLELDGFDRDYPISLAWNAANTHPLVSAYIDYVKEYLANNQKFLLSDATPPADRG